MSESLLAVSAFSATNPVVGYTAGSLRTISDLPTLLGTINFNVQRVGSSPDGSLVAVGLTGGTRLYVYDTSDWTRVFLAGGDPPGNVYDVEFSPDNSLLAVSHSTSPYLTVYNTSTWAKVTLTGGNPAGTGYGCAFSPDGTRLAVAHANSPSFTIYDTSTWGKITTGSPGYGFGNCVAYSPDGTKLALGNSVNGLDVLETTGWTSIHNDGTVGSAMSCTFSPDGTKLAIGGNAGLRIRVLNVANWSAFSLSGGVGDTVNDCSFSLDNSMLAVAAPEGSDYTRPVVYETTTWTKLSPLPAHEGWTFSVRFLPATIQAYSISGEVRDDTGTLANRVARLYRRSDGMLLAEGTTPGGAMQFDVLSTGQLQRVVLDNNNVDPLNNDIIDRVMVP